MSGVFATVDRSTTNRAADSIRTTESTNKGKKTFVLPLKYSECSPKTRRDPALAQVR